MNDSPLASPVKPPLSMRRTVGVGGVLWVLCQMLVVACAPADPVPSGGATGTGGGNLGTGGAGGNGALGCAEAPARLATGCMGGQCHNPENDIAWGDLVTTNGLAARLINVDTRVSIPCNGQTKLVNPTKPASGVLFERLTTNTCGNPQKQMPPLDASSDQQLSESARASLVACLKSWLEPQLK